MMPARTGVHVWYYLRGGLVSEVEVASSDLPVHACARRLMSTFRVATNPPLLELCTCDCTVLLANLR